MKLLIACCILFSTFASAQSLKLKDSQGGIVSVGVRTTISAFNDGQVSDNGMGVGGQFRIQLADKVNSDWFFDYISGDVGGLAKRTDYHIGWSVLFYPTKNLTPKVRPYFLMGHCFDYTQFVANNNRMNYMERWSSAVQGGIGAHFNLSERLDISTVCQYMVHLGTDIHSEIVGNDITFHKEKGASLEGHLLFNISLNYKIADLW